MVQEFLTLKNNTEIRNETRRETFNLDSSSRVYAPVTTNTDASVRSFDYTFAPTIISGSSQGQGATIKKDVTSTPNTSSSPSFTPSTNASVDRGENREETRSPITLPSPSLLTVGLLVVGAYFIFGR